MFCATAPLSRRAAPAAVRKLAGIAAALVFAVLLTPSHASAARAVSGCFGSGGVSVSGLYTQVEYLYGGEWYPVQGSLSKTDGYGCVRYTLSARLSQRNLMIAAAGTVPTWNALVWGSTPWMSNPGASSAWLGWTSLSWSRLQNESWGDTSGWMDSMTDPTRRSLCDDATMAVACFMDERGMVANGVVVPKDQDGDHIPDSMDNHPNDQFRP